MELDIDTVDWHDATLLAVAVAWPEGTCTVAIRHGTLGDCTLVFSRVINLNLPRRQDWGRSGSIDVVSCINDGARRYDVMMQSGDLIQIEAAEVALTVTAP